MQPCTVRAWETNCDHSPPSLAVVQLNLDRMNFRGKGSLSLSHGLNLGSDSLSLGSEGLNLGSDSLSLGSEGLNLGSEGLNLGGDVSHRLKGRYNRVGESCQRSHAESKLASRLHIQGNGVLEERMEALKINVKDMRNWAS